MGLDFEYQKLLTINTKLIVLIWWSVTVHELMNWISFYVFIISVVSSRNVK